MSAFKEENYKGLCVYNYSQKVVNRIKNNGNRFKMLFCIALPSENKSVKGITLASGFSSMESAKAYVDAHQEILMQGLIPSYKAA
jgi:hypothetical protein